MSKKLKKSSLYKTVLRDYEKESRKLVNTILSEKIPSERNPRILVQSKENVLNKGQELKKIKKSEFFKQLTKTFEALDDFIVNKSNLKK